VAVVSVVSADLYAVPRTERLIRNARALGTSAPTPLILFHAIPAFLRNIPREGRVVGIWNSVVVGSGDLPRLAMAAQRDDATIYRRRSGFLRAVLLTEKSDLFTSVHTIP
jgi:hypothetical protein